MTENWRSLSLCVDAPELFFKNEDEKWIDLKKAKAFCLDCPVQVNCLDYAIRAREPYGVWRSDFAVSS